jgi:PHD/YefM family antitoxin component YafN of YafNO toxin-antitoxin module
MLRTAMKTMVEIAEAQARLPRLLRGKKTITICRRGRPVAFLVSCERMESILETLEIQANPKAMRAIRRAKLGKGNYIPLRQIEKEMHSVRMAQAITPAWTGLISRNMGE